MRHVGFLFGVILLATCSTAWMTQIEAQTVSPAQVPVTKTQKASLDSVVQFLLTSAATDFHDHGPAGPLRFRKVRIGHAVTNSADKHYRLCGQFLRTQKGVKSQWTPFATIKTSGYEQMIGAQAEAYCQDSSFIWDKVGDLSSALQRRYDSLR